MKKIYSIALALAAGLFTATAAPVTNQTTGTDYDNMKAAVDVVANGDIIIVNENQVCPDRITGKASMTYTVKGATEDIVLTWGNLDRPLILSDANNSHVIVEDIILDGAETSSNQNFARADKANGNRLITLNNVKIQNVITTNANGLLYSTNTGAGININNVTVSNCTYNDGLADLVIEGNSSKCTISGTNSLSILLRGTTSIAASNIGAENNVTLYFEETRTSGEVAVKGCDNPALFKCGSAKFVLKAENGNLVAVDKSLVGVDPVVNETTNTPYNNLSDAITAANDSDVILVNTDQTISSRLGIGKNVIIKGNKEGVKLIRATDAKSLMLLINSGNANVSFENIIIDGNNIEATACGIESSNKCNLYLTNVTLTNFSTTNSQGILCAKNGGHVFAENVVFENSTVPAGRGEVFIGANGSKISGNNVMSIFIQKDNNISAENLTNTTPITLFFDSKVVSDDPKVAYDGRADNLVAVYGCDDLSKFAIGQEDYKLKAVEGNIVTVDPLTLGVEEIGADDVNAPVEYFNLQGVKVAEPAAGNLYIKRQGSTVTKVIL